MRKVRNSNEENTSGGECAVHLVLQGKGGSAESATDFVRVSGRTRDNGAERPAPAFEVSCQARSGRRRTCGRAALSGR